MMAYANKPISRAVPTLQNSLRHSLAVDGEAPMSLTATTQAKTSTLRDAPAPTRQRTAANDSELAMLQSVGSVCRFTRNETVFADGDEARYSYQVISGTVRLVQLMADGRRHIAG